MGGEMVSKMRQTRDGGKRVAGRLWEARGTGKIAAGRLCGGKGVEGVRPGDGEKLAEGV